MLGLIVGLVMVGQTPHGIVLDRKAEFAALKAMGSSEWQLLSLLANQATFLALIGSVFGLLGVAVAQHYFSTPRAQIETPLWLTAGSVALVFVISHGAAVLPYFAYSADRSLVRPARELTMTHAIPPLSPVVETIGVRKHFRSRLHNDGGFVRR